MATEYICYRRKTTDDEFDKVTRSGEVWGGPNRVASGGGLAVLAWKGRHSAAAGDYTFCTKTHPHPTFKFFEKKRAAKVLYKWPAGWPGVEFREDGAYVAIQIEWATEAPGSWA